MKIGKKILGTILSLGLAIGGVTAAYTPATVSAEIMTVYAPSIYYNYHIGSLKRTYDTTFSKGYWANHIWMGGNAHYMSCGTAPLATNLRNPYERSIYNTVNGKYWYKTVSYWSNEKASDDKIVEDRLYLNQISDGKACDSFDELVEHQWNFVDYRPLNVGNRQYEYFTIYVTEEGREYIKDVVFDNYHTQMTASSARADAFSGAWIAEFWVAADKRIGSR